MTLNNRAGGAGILLAAFQAESLCKPGFVGRNLFKRGNLQKTLSPSSKD